MGRPSQLRLCGSGPRIQRLESSQTGLRVGGTCRHLCYDGLDEAAHEAEMWRVVYIERTQLEVRELIADASEITLKRAEP